MLIRVRDDERGMAMVIALIVSLVLLTLGTVVVAQSIHDAESSGLDRRRLQSVDAAEAGNNYYYAYLQSTTVATLNCQPVTQTIATAPATASFTATPTFYDAAGVVMPCSSATPFTSTYYPASVAITTTGSVGTRHPARCRRSSASRPSTAGSDRRSFRSRARRSRTTSISTATTETTGTSTS